MHGVVEVLEKDLPIGAEEDTETAADDLELAGGSAVDHVVERRAGVAEICREVRTLLGKAGKDKATIILDPRHMHHRQTRIGRVEPGPLVAVLERNRMQRAVGLIGPAVVAAAEELDVALAVADHLGAAMAAAIVEDVDGAVAVPAHHHRLPAERRRDVIARTCHLAVVADIDPGPTENPFHLELEELGVDVDIAVDTVRPDELPDRRTIIRHRHLLSPCRALGTSGGLV